MAITVTKVSETSNKITLGWTPVPGSLGYRYYADDKPVSNTWNPATKQATFSKGPKVYRIEAVGVDDSGLYPPSVVTPPPTPAGPTKPGNLRVLSSLQTAISIGWDASTDDVAVTNYKIYRDNLLIGEGAGSAGGYGDSWSDTGLVCGKSYSYGVEAFDADGNVSPRAMLTTSTAACDTVPPPTSGNVIKINGTVSGSTLLSQIAAAPAGAVTIQPADGQTMFTVTDDIFQMNRNTVTIKNGKFQNLVAIDGKGSGFVLDGCSFHALGLRNVHDWTIQNCVVAINGQAWNSQWFGPIAGSWIEGCKNWKMLNSTFSGHYDAVTTSRHSEAWFICAGNDGGLIKNCTFDNGGTTGHLFWTYFETEGSKPNPRNICVTGCNFLRCHNPWFHTQLRSELKPEALNNRLDTTTCTFDSSAANPMGNEAGIYTAWLKACSAA